MTHTCSDFDRTLFQRGVLLNHFIICWFLIVENMALVLKTNGVYLCVSPRGWSGGAI